MFKVDNFLSEILSCYVKKSISKVECMQKLNKLTGDCVDKNVKMKCSELIVHNDTLSILENLHPHVLHQISVLFAIVCPIVDCQQARQYDVPILLVRDWSVVFFLNEYYHDSNDIIMQDSCNFEARDLLNQLNGWWWC
ncbi:hypothetical protein T4E_11393 [Trichinella pseudospiralis]|uniref:Uncharacterized protein n=1 Tax=Trichinella pseudospiralis TaxID=6337 RepID=A0A0V0XH06_TRIPS|nr:hypothetical protein T4E_11393 [Trichinella pseudospiralis]